MDRVPELEQISNDYVIDWMALREIARNSSLNRSIIPSTAHFIRLSPANQVALIMAIFFETRFVRGIFLALEIEKKAVVIGLRPFFGLDSDN